MKKYTNKFLCTILAAAIALSCLSETGTSLLAPKIVGDKVGLHAVFTMMAILIGGNLGGLLGMLIAVPIFASIKNLITNWYNNSGLENERMKTRKETIIASIDVASEKEDTKEFQKNTK